MAQQTSCSHGPAVVQAVRGKNGYNFIIILPKYRSGGPTEGEGLKIVSSTLLLCTNQILA